jgi:hypothetical protein
MDDQLIEQLRQALPPLIRERPEIAAEIQIRLRDAFASKDDLRAVIEAMDRRFEEARVESNRRFDRLEARLDLGLLGLGRFADRLGHKMEDVIAGALRFALQRPEIQPDRVRVRQVFIDQHGRFGRQGRRAEMDTVAADGKTYLLEAKSSADRDDVEALAEKSEFVARMMGLAPGSYETVLATLDKSEEIRDACRERGITLL